MTAFPASVVDAVLAHMNDDHADDNLLIVRASGAFDATAARMTALDGTGGTWLATTPAGERELTVPWSAPISERPEIRREVVALTERAARELGVECHGH
ncbi:DUF2470 domain-containing protein [Pseudoclavibacter chungangensis]|uniref:DUF2470 domain-containing protein n=1 Tax=Pseudoclavibacter chungangensis TaxID=587635 RepID=A0A7J5C222_9MICO|nr:DUF2470 domain-containing protein [Pseudoclavibacter chungangensis]KAB1662513.1 DUF2470 domain-containing protein [Pseudoclavibacter chungangensis]NYJ68551.1 hypothetical protein [Pseudoclavibacter chungangensis]